MQYVDDSSWLGPAAKSGAVAFALLALSLAPARAQEEKDVQMNRMAQATNVEASLMAALEDEGLTVFARLVRAADLEDEFDDEEDLTFFVPRNAAYTEIAEDAVEGVDKARDAVHHLTTRGTTTLLDMLDDGENLASLRPFGAVGGLSVEVGDSGELLVSDTDQTARILGEPIWAGDHVIHVIDTVLLPSDDTGS